jgi:[ribosomal protein S18]-alanine N-acetyltransferase
MSRINPQIRWMIRADMETVLAIESNSFDYPWTAEELRSVLRARNCIGAVAELRKQVLGYMVYELHENRIHLLNIAVDPQFRRQGVGSALLNRLIDKLSQQRRREVVLEVRDPNVAAQLWLRHNGFIATGMLHDHYEDTEEDAIRFIYRLDWRTAEVA